MAVARDQPALALVDQLLHAPNVSDRLILTNLGRPSTVGKVLSERHHLGHLVWGIPPAFQRPKSRGRALRLSGRGPEKNDRTVRRGKFDTSFFIARNSRTPSRRSEREDHPRASRPPPLALALGLLKPLACPLRPSLPRAGSLLRARPQRWSRSLDRRERDT